MKSTIDDHISRIAHRTHTPRGQHAAGPQTYQSLLDRIPAELRPVVGQHHSPRSTFPRWCVAACLCLVIGIGLAIAGVWYQHYRQPPITAEDQPVTEQPDSRIEPRTLVYQQVPLADIVTELSAVFLKPIQIANPDLADYRITATFSTEESLSEILAILSEIAGFEVRETPERIIIE